MNVVLLLSIITLGYNFEHLFHESIPYDEQITFNLFRIGVYLEYRNKLKERRLLES